MALEQPYVFPLLFPVQASNHQRSFEEDEIFLAQWES